MHKSKMKTIAVDGQSRVKLVYNEYGQPIGDESVGLASFLGPLVREVVRVTLENWKKLPTRLKLVLWKSIEKKSSSDPTSISRIMLWTKAHTKKDGQPVNSQVAQALLC
ncbi:hypothetical protein SDJN03_21652, partial [Cucurbita argyrosperma subsp. sororia]